MMWFLGIVAVLLMGTAAVAATGRLGQLPPVVDDIPAPVLPEGDLSADDLRDVRFAIVPRGYSMAQVDELLARLAAQLGNSRAESLE